MKVNETGKINNNKKIDVTFETCFKYRNYNNYPMLKIFCRGHDYVIVYDCY